MERIEREGRRAAPPVPRLREDRGGERSFDDHRAGSGRHRDEGSNRDHESGHPFRSRFEVGEDERPSRRAFEPRFEDRRERRPDRPGGRDERPAAKVAGSLQECRARQPAKRPEPAAEAVAEAGR